MCNNVGRRCAGPTCKKVVRVNTVVPEKFAELSVVSDLQEKKNNTQPPGK
jgi:hypothetical protein